MTTDTKVGTQDTAEVKVPVESQEGKVAEAGKEQPDYPKIIGQLQTRQASLEQALADATGSARKQAELEALIVRGNQLIEATIAHLTDPDVPPAALAIRVQEIKKQDETARATSYVQQVRDGYAADIIEGLTDLGFKSELEDPRFAEGHRLWVEADEAKDLVGYHKAFREVNRVLRVIGKERGEKMVADKTKEAEQRFKVENGALAPMLTSGTPAGITMKIEKPAFDPRGGHIRQLQAWEKQQAVKTGSQ